MHNRREAGCTTGVGGEGTTSRKRERGKNSQPDTNTLSIISQTYRFTFWKICTVGDLALDGIRLYARTKRKSLKMRWDKWGEGHYIFTLLK